MPQSPFVWLVVTVENEVTGAGAGMNAADLIAKVTVESPIGQLIIRGHGQWKAERGPHCEVLPQLLVGRSCLLRLGFKFVQAPGWFLTELMGYACDDKLRVDTDSVLPVHLFASGTAYAPRQFRILNPGKGHPVSIEPA